MQKGGLHWDDPADYDRMRDVLARANFSREGIRAKIGLESTADRDATGKEIRRHRTSDGGPLSTLMRTFMLAIPVDRERFREAVAPMTIEGWERAGLITVEGSNVLPAVHIATHGSLLLAYDMVNTNYVPIASDHVMGLGPSSRTLANATVRHEHVRTMDLGAGCGVQSLLAAAHSDEVVATDTNPRALNMTAFNARLNGYDNVACLEGSLFEPVKDRRFDLIVSNPPFVISPKTEYIYRDSGLPADEMCRQIVRQAPSHLVEGGYCQLLTNWAHVAGEDDTERIREWFAGTGCDAWIIRKETQESAVYAQAWLGHTEGHSSPERRAELFEQWMRYYDEMRIEAVSAGIICLRNSGRQDAWFHIEDCLPTSSTPWGDWVERCFVLQDLLHADPAAFLNTPLRTSPSVLLEMQHAQSPDGWIVSNTQVRHAHGLAFADAVSPLLADLVSQLIEPASPRSVIQGLQANADGQIPESDIANILGALRQLVAHGMLLPVG
jgi:hypothetical protein